MFKINNDLELEMTGEGIESVVNKNAYDYLFNPDVEAEINKKVLDSILIHRQFVKLEHLELPEHRINHDLLHKAI